MFVHNFGTAILLYRGTSFIPHNGYIGTQDILSQELKLMNDSEESEKQKDSGG